MNKELYNACALAKYAADLSTPTSPIPVAAPGSEVTPGMAIPQGAKPSLAEQVAAQTAAESQEAYIDNVLAHREAMQGIDNQVGDPANMEDVAAAAAESVADPDAPAEEKVAAINFLDKYAFGIGDAAKYISNNATGVANWATSKSFALPSGGGFANKGFTKGYNTLSSVAKSIAANPKRSMGIVAAVPTLGAAAYAGHRVYKNRQAQQAQLQQAQLQQIQQPPVNPALNKAASIYINKLAAINGLLGVGQGNPIADSTFDADSLFDWNAAPAATLLTAAPTNKPGFFRRNKKTIGAVSGVSAATAATYLGYKAYKKRQAAKRALADAAQNDALADAAMDDPEIKTAAIDTYLDKIAFGVPGVISNNLGSIGVGLGSGLVGAGLGAYGMYHHMLGNDANENAAIQAILNDPVTMQQVQAQFPGMPPEDAAAAYYEAAQNA